MRISKPGLHCLVLLLASFAGCGRGPETSELTGQVTFQGKPLDHGMISFFPASGRPTGAAIQADGTYGMKVPPGSYGVIVLAPAKLPEGFREGDPLPPPDPNPLPAKYGRQETSGLTATVETGNGLQTVNFDLH